ncbi:MAG: GNAT family N-acetyltransferase [Chloroflexales bacterium]|nr:GNAT family N-acetyltransferase [Chloroflexales bacterium]
MNKPIAILNYRPEHHPAIRRILEHIGWAEQYIAAAEYNADAFAHDSLTFGVYVAVDEPYVVGFVYVQYWAWNELAQLQGLAVEPAYQRQGIASALVQRAEAFAKTKSARGVYVDTPISNQGGRKFYEALGYHFAYQMPRYYEATLDGVTYQKFFSD